MGGSKKIKEPEPPGPSPEEQRLEILRRQAELERFRGTRIRATILSPASSVGTRFAATGRGFDSGGG